MSHSAAQGCCYSADMWIENPIIQAIIFSLDSIPVSVEAIGDNCIGRSAGNLLCLFKRFARILIESSLSDLTGQEVTGLRIQDIPDPFVVFILTLFFDEHRGFIGVLDVADFGFILL